jgi:hypothetical protein
VCADIEDSVDRNGRGHSLCACRGKCAICEGSFYEEDAGHNLNDTKGLTLQGVVVLKPLSIFAMTIGAADEDTTYTPMHVQRVSGTGDLYLEGDLELMLDQYTPKAGDIITLLTWSADVTRVGTFQYANGQKIVDGLLYIDAYEFSLTYDDINRSVFLTATAIPEPATMALLTTLALVGMVWLRRGKKSVR